MIWVFDSWLWGLVTLWYFQQQLPEYDFLYLGDTKHLPYGTKSPQFLQQRTFACLDWMFEQWCKIVIIACNTAASYACKPRQNTYPDRKVLSITVPWVEKVIQIWSTRPLLLATQATIESDAYEVVRARRHPSDHVDFVPLVGRWLVDLIERTPSQEIQHSKTLSTLVGRLLDTVSWYDSVVLGCTHYPLIIDHVRSHILGHVPIIDAWYEASTKMADYLDRHIELWVLPGSWKINTYVTSASIKSSTHDWYQSASVVHI